MQWCTHRKTLRPHSTPARAASMMPAAAKPLQVRWCAVSQAARTCCAGSISPLLRRRGPRRSRRSRRPTRPPLLAALPIELSVSDCCHDAAQSQASMRSRCAATVEYTVAPFKLVTQLTHSAQGGQACAGAGAAHQVHFWPVARYSQLFASHSRSFARYLQLFAPHSHPFASIRIH